MRVACLFSGGTDSALAALLLEPLCSVTLVTGSFGVEIPGVAETPGRATSGPVDHARAAADALGMDHRRFALDPAVAEAAVDRMVDDGYPRHGIQRVHEHALEVVAGLQPGEHGETTGGPTGGHADDLPAFDAVADGTRRDDRVPMLSPADARSLEDRAGRSYLRPLAGIGRAAIDDLADVALVVERGPSGTLPTGDYETELRALMADEHGAETVERVFPEHVQSRVVGRRSVPAGKP